MTNYEELVTKLRDVYRAYVVTGNEKAEQFLADAAAAIEALQAQLPKRGGWERELDVHDEPFYQCSVCGECFDSNRDSTHEVFKYCPDCGAKMEVQDGEEN